MPTPSFLYRLFAIALLVAVPADAGAQARRAVLVGINRYEDAAPATLAAAPAPAAARGRITNLNGAVNDAVSMRDLLQARFAFGAGDVTLLTDAKATRAGILAAIDTLLAQSAKGDIAVFYYAGHGSQRRNSLSPEASKLDQTLVPADANAGAFDIRDKELARAFNRFMDKGVELVLIFDSCHSGSVARGGLEGAGSGLRERWAAIDPRDAADPGVDKTPEDRGAVVLSAAQDYQPATELVGATGQPNGLFTSALVSTLLSMSPNESVSEVFKSVKARMQTNGHSQEPVLAGAPTRLKQPLFGGVAGARSRTSVAVLRVNGDGMVTLQGGPAVGIREGAVLRKIGVPSDTGIRVRVDTVVGISETRATVVEGARNRISAGDRFELERWVAAPTAGIMLALPPAGPSAAGLRALATEMSKLRAAPKIQWIDDVAAAPADSTPTFVMSWTGTGWQLRPHVGAPIALAANPTAEQVRSAITTRERRPVRFILTLPPAGDIAAKLNAEFGEANVVQLTKDLSAGHYALVGRAGAEGIEYALVARSASAENAATAPMPQRTDWFALSDSTAPAKLIERAYTLAKVRSWLTLDAPPNDGVFPYRLAFRRMTDSALVREGPFTQGERYEVVLVADSAAIKPWLERRRVYVFGIDSHGNGALLYPRSNVENRVPYGLTAANTWPTEIPLGPRSAFNIRPPFGTDTFILLAADESVDPGAFEWQGVRVASRGAGLSALLRSTSSTTRAAGGDAPANWSIQRVQVLSRPRQ